MCIESNYSLGRLQGTLVLVVKGDLSKCVGGEIMHVGGFAPLITVDIFASEGGSVVCRRIPLVVFRQSVGHNSYVKTN